MTYMRYIANGQLSLGMLTHGNKLALATKSGTMARFAHSLDKRIKVACCSSVSKQNWWANPTRRPIVIAPGLACKSGALADRGKVPTLTGNVP